MSKRKRIALAVLVALVVLLAGGGVLGYSFLRSGLPDYSEEITLDELQVEVTVNRNARGVPFIEAQEESDLHYVQGYLHAQDRLWQMELQRRVVQGRLSEVLGEDQLSTDSYLRKVGLKRIAERMLENTTSRSQDILENYTRGVNAYMENNPLPVEFRLLGFEPEPWTPLDSVGIISLMAFDLGGNWREETLRYAMAEELEQELFNEILPPYDDWDTPRIWTPERAAEAKGEKPLQAKLVDFLEETSLEEFKSVPRLGSNSWVISPRLSATGTAVMANDPHLSLGLPSIWYENSLILGGEDKLSLYGWSIPGSPGVIIGNNRSIAWGMTNIGDTQDLFLEKRHPDNPHKFKYDGEWYEAEVDLEEVWVEGQDEPEIVEVIYTRHGPLISEDPPMSLRWTAYEVETSTADSVFKLNRATSWDEFNDAIVHFSVPVQAVVYADVKGNIGFRVAGNLPVRKEGRGLMPSPGWEEGHGWDGFIPLEEMPVVYNPPEDYIATANHRVETDDYPYIISLDNAPHYRKQHIADFLGAAGTVSLKDSKNLQTDWHNRHAQDRLPQFLDVLVNNTGKLDETERESLELLKQWAEEPVNEKDSSAAALFQVWYLKLMEEVFRDKLGSELFEEFLRHDYIAYNSLEYLLEIEESAWLPEGLAQPLLESYSRSVEELTELLGPDTGDWRWDELQTIIFEHDLGVAPVIGDYLFNRGPYPYGGDHMTTGRARYALDDPFNVIGGAGLRYIAEMGDTVNIRAVIAGGQSGHPLSPHYSDQLETWLAGEYYNTELPRDPEREWASSTVFSPVVELIE